MELSGLRLVLLGLGHLLRVAAGGGRVEAVVAAPELLASQNHLPELLHVSVVLPSVVLGAPIRAEHRALPWLHSLVQVIQRRIPFQGPHYLRHNHQKQKNISVRLINYLSYYV